MRLIPLLLATATLGLSAQEASLGGRIHGLLPMGDLRSLTNGQIGLGLAAFVDIPISGGLVLRPLVGVQHIPKGDTLGLAGTKTRVTSVDLMVEGLWYPGDDSEKGPYLVGAVGLQQWRISATGLAASSLSYGRIGASAGLGFQINRRLGLEARGFWSPVSPTLTATGLTGGATLRF
jgi:hypothetical protein